MTKGSIGAFTELYGHSTVIIVKALTLYRLHIEEQGNLKVLEHKTTNWITNVKGMKAGYAIFNACFNCVSAEGCMLPMA